jgi:hypothetical protein
MPSQHPVSHTGASPQPTQRLVHQAAGRQPRPHRRPPRWLTSVMIGLLVLGLITATADDTALAQSTGWISLFDGTPSSPQPYNPSTWDVIVHSRDRETWKQLQPMEAHHGSNCAGAPASHQITSYQDAVFQCNGHIMTAIKAEGYGLIVLTPNQMVDFSSGEAVIKFDMSTFRSSPRDWVSVWLSPFDDNFPLPLGEWLPDLSGDPRRAIEINMGTNSGQTNFDASIINNHVGRALPSSWWLGYESFLTTSAVRRDPFELRISRTSLKFGMPTYNQWWVDTTFPDIGWDRAVLQLAHHSYNPLKECPTSSCAPNTWHWDNVSISQAIPFTMLKGDLPYVDPSSRRYVQFNPSAPAGSYLRFAGIGNEIQISFNGGATWQTAQRKEVEKNSDELFKPYWTAVPAGTTRIDFRGTGWWGGDWLVRDPSIWSQSTATSPAPAPTPVSSCSPRPQTIVQTQALGGGRLQVILQSPRTAAAPNNSIRSVRVVQAPNAQVDILGQQFGASGGTVSPPAGTQTVTFTVTRQAAGAITVPLVVTDDCGGWSTFVGGGAAAF